MVSGVANTPSGPVVADVAVRDGKIVGVGAYPDAAERIDCTGLDVLPGVIFLIAIPMWSDSDFHDRSIHHRD